jgi:phasin family protein
MAAHTPKDPPADDFNPFTDLTKTFEQFKMPGPAVEAFVDARRKDVAALMAANQATYHALQALARTQADLLTHAMQGMQETAKGALAGSTGRADGAAATKHGDAAPAAWESMLADMKKLADMAQKFQADAVAGLAAQAKENVARVKGHAQTK